MFSAQECDQLSHLILRKRVFEARHLLAAVFDLAGDLRGLQLSAGVGQRGSLVRTLGSVAVAVGATLVAKEQSAGTCCILALRAV